jgi:phosphatidate cytidylyltransferase
MLKKLLIRTVSGMVFITVMIGAIRYHPVSYGILMVLIIGIMTWEYFRITLHNRQIFGQIVAFISGWILFMLFYVQNRYQMEGTWFLLLVFPIITIRISLLYHNKKEEYTTFFALFVPLVYIALPFSLTNMLAFDHAGHFNGVPILSLFVILWASDVGAYIFGMGFGQKNGHKLFPSLSPKKSWEGFGGGLLTALIAGFVLYQVGWLSFPLIYCFTLSILLHIFGVWGDLAESQLKRHHHVKDSGKVMPGHGGLLDRFDSALFAFPVAIAFIKFLHTLS